MSKISKITERGTLASFLCFVAIMAVSLTASAQKKMNSFNTPDFNFPKTVEKNADTEFSKAMREHNGLNALKAAIQLDIASGLVSSDTYAASLERFDSVARVMPAPYNSLARLLEARLLCDIYNSKRWQFDRREVPSGEIPENVMEWNTGIFKKEVRSLVADAASGIESSANVDIATIKPLLADADDAIAMKFSVADFITFRIPDILGNFRMQDGNPIPFSMADDEESLSIKYVDQAIARHEKDADPLLLSLFCREKLQLTDNIDKRKELIEECINRFIETPYAGSFLVDYCEEVKEKDPKESLPLLSDYLKKFPNATDAASIKAEINELSTRTVSATMLDCILSGRETPIELSGKNIYDFHILVYKIADADTGNRNPDIRQEKLAQLGKPLHSVPVHVDGEFPSSFKTTVNLPKLDPGVYTLAYSSNDNASGLLENNKKANLRTFCMTGITSFVSSGNRSESRYVYVVSAINQKPIAGAKVKFWQRGKWNSYSVHSVVETDSEGKAAIPAKCTRYRIDYAGDAAEGYCSEYYGSDNSNNERLAVKLFTDLSIYHPGDKVQFAAIAYTEKQESLAIASSRKIKVRLNDANGEELDSLLLVTDADGRANGSFILPKQGLLGTWNLDVVGVDDSDCYWYGSVSFKVADYKAPTFFVEVTSDSENFKIGETLKFKGYAKTFSGMPLTSGKVAYKIDYRYNWWFRNVTPDTYMGETGISKEGTFTIELPTEGLVGNRYYERGSYTITVSVTDKAGETAESEPLLFSFANDVKILPSLQNQEELTDDVLEARVNVYDMSMHPVKKEVFYEVQSDGKTVKSGSFESPLFKIDMKGIPSDRYAFRFALDPKDFKDPELRVDSVTVWRQSDIKPAETTQLWLPEREIVATKGARKVKVKVGSSFPDSWIFAQFCTSRSEGKTQWIRLDNGIAEVETDVPGFWESGYVNFIATRDLQMVKGEVEVIPEERLSELEISSESFRESVAPGAEETWKFRFTVAGVDSASIPVMAVMSNKALNSLAPFRWSFNPICQISRSSSMDLSFAGVYYDTFSVSLYDSSNPYKNRWTELPQWQLYGYMLYNGESAMYGSVMMRQSSTKAMLSAPTNAAMPAMVEESAVMDMAGAIEPDGVAEEKVDASEPESSEVLRDIDTPLAFFMPDLTADSKGVATLSFKAPQFVGAWQLQMLGYTPELKGCTATFDVVSAKAVMGQLNAPRFLRTGDKAAVAATLYNNSGEQAAVSGRMEFVNAISGGVVATQDFAPEEVLPAESRTVVATLDVPSDVDALYIRVYAYLGSHTDGEQALVPVLPSSTPVRESTPFYLAPGEEIYSLILPKFTEGEKLTLTYSDNPVWDCVMALPSIVTETSSNALSRAYALYGNAVAAALFGRYPALVEGVRMIAEEDDLVSPLQKNGDLKNFALNNTPWVNDAKSESLRMQSLLKYADPAEAQSAVDEMMKTLADTQLADGGWSWCPDMESSEFITRGVVHVLAALSEIGCMPEGGGNMARKACAFLDGKFVSAWKESKRKYVPVTTLLGYLCDKSALPCLGSSTADFRQLEAEAMKKIRTDWGEFNIYNKADAAILLERRSEPRLARTILESLRQYASQSHDRGMWFDNLSGRFSGDGPVLSTARVLQAFELVEPGVKDIDLLRQWLVISKQTQNWGDCRCTATAINALLAGGSDWTTPSASLIVTLSGEPLTIDNVQKVTGSFVCNLDPKAASGADLTIVRNGVGPAWGGVVASFVQPIADVKADAIPEISIEKKVFTVSASGSGPSADSFKVGDRVMVSLVITTDRDLDYVAVADSRSACLEPVDQISGYQFSDGIGYYREERNESTNLFIPFLPKGTHVIGYECMVDREGVYSLGIASAQSQYAPAITAHSAGKVITSKK